MARTPPFNPASITQFIPLACSDEDTPLTTGASKLTFRMPTAFTLTGIKASVTIAPTGSPITIDIKVGGSTILSTLLTIDANETTSVTAAIPVVISNSAIAVDSEVTVKINAVGSTIAGAGLKVYLIGGLS